MAGNDDFVDENLPWPLWRPLMGTFAGVVAITAWSFVSPLDTYLQSSMYGGVAGRTLLIFALLYFPCYSRRGWPWRLTAFALIFAAGALATIAAPRQPPPVVTVSG